MSSSRTRPAPPPDRDKRTRPDRRPWLLILFAACVAGLLLMFRAASGWQSAGETGFTPELRQGMAFALIFNAGLGLLLLLATLGSGLGSVLALLRRRAGLAEAAGRLVLPVLLLVGFGAGHFVLNPWMAQAARIARGLLG